MTEDARLRWEAERERREIAELEELARMLIARYGRCRSNAPTGA